MSAWQDYRIIWQAALVQRQPRAIRVAEVLITLVLAASAVFGLAKHAWAYAIWAGLGISMVVVLFTWVMFFVPAVALMNSPANVRLVPRMHRRLIEMTVAGWVVAGASGLLFPDWHAAPLVAVWVIGMSIARGGVQTTGSFVAALPVTSQIWVKMLPAWLVQFLLTLPGFLCACIVVALLATYAMRLILPAGGEGHYRRRERQAATIVRLESMGRKDSTYVPKRSLNLYVVTLRHACRFGDPRRLLLYAIGPGAYWTSTALACSLMLLVAAVVKILLFAFATADTLEAVAAMGWTAPTALLFVHFSIVEQCKVRIAAAKTEEALARMAARSPATYKLNRCLATQLMHNVLLSWLIVTGTVMIVTALTGATPIVLAVVASLCTFGLTPSVAWILRDYAREETGASVVRFVLAVIAVVAVIGAVIGAMLAYFRHGGNPVWLPLLALGVNLVGGVFAVTRWKKMLAAPVAFPAGRLT